ncbi:MAG: PEP-CTERM sorting domain-containing protein [Candidatus Polarisedimenticolaceae bacterium]|nr:PEP-CTERM sorting domain-containing protein [Candidatus Polarisedimenticolaceae bacterium]
MNTKQIIKKSALAGAMFLGVSGVAQAGALAISIVEIDNLLFSQGGAVLEYPTNFSALAYTSDSNVDVDLNGASLSDSDFSSNGAPMDLYKCLGDCTTYNDNDFTGAILSGTSGYPNNNFALADSREGGSPIDGVGGFGSGLGASLANASQAGVVGDSEGSSSSNNGLQAAWTFTGISGAIDITFDLKLYLETLVEIGDIFPTKAAADYTISFSICDDSVQFSGCPEYWSESLVGSKSSIAPSGNGNPHVIGDGWGIPSDTNQVFTTDALDVDKKYQLTARITTAADVVSVPEPTTLALLGIALLGFGAARKRRTA